jgi:hypothetical protein
VSRSLAIGTAAVAVLLGAILLIRGGDDPPTSPLGFDGSDYTAESAVIWAVGDGADGGEEAIALADSIPTDIDRLLYLGDVYEDGTAEEYEDNYEPVYGQFDEITSPVIGNHEWPNRKEGYLAHWEDAAGGKTPLSYAFKLAGWELIALNSEGDDGPRAADVKLLRSELTEPGDCRLAFWHTPRYSAGFHPDEKAMEPYWKELAGRASLILNGHDHNTQVFKPIRGITQIIAGAGGHDYYAIDESDPRLEFFYDGGPSALRLELEPGLARYAVFDAEGDELDAGEVECERLPPGPSS